MASADHPAAPAAQTHRAARSCTLASRCALVSVTSPLTADRPPVENSQCKQLRSLQIVGVFKHVASQSVSLCAVAQRWFRLAGASCCPVDSMRCRYSQLRQNYITPHFVKWPSVVTLKLHLMSPTAGAPSRVYKTGVMQNCLHWSGRTAVGAPRSRSRPTRRRLHALVVIVTLWLHSGAARLVLVSGLRPVITCEPLPTRRGLAAIRGIGPARRLPVRPPWGLPQPGAKTSRLTAATINRWSSQSETVRRQASCYSATWLHRWFFLAARGRRGRTPRTNIGASGAASNARENLGIVNAVQQKTLCFTRYIELSTVSTGQRT